MCGSACSQNEECRYDFENCEYKCNPLDEVTTQASTTQPSTTQVHSSSRQIMIWAPIVAVASALIIGLLIFFGVRHFRSNAKVKNTTSVEKQPDYEVPYQYTINRNCDQNEGVNIENEETYEAYYSAEYETYYEMYAEYENKSKRWKNEIPKDVRAHLKGWARSQCFQIVTFAIK